MIEVHGLTKKYGATTAVDRLSFTVEPGTVTGFLGPNGAGKSTTMRMLLGLDRPDAGQALILGVDYRAHRAPLRSVGALLDASEVPPGRLASAHLLSLAVTIGEGRRRVEAVLDAVGLTEVAHRRIGTFSLGMRQRLGLAAALLGDPAVVILDEPVNGLDPDGVLWVRGLIRNLAAEGRTVLVSSHLMAEMAQTADHVLVIGAGRLLADCPIQHLLGGVGTTLVLASPELSRLLPALIEAGAELVERSGERAELRGVENRAVASTAARMGVPVYELYRRERSLEEAFMELTHEVGQFTGTAATLEQVIA